LFTGGFSNPLPVPPFIAEHPVDNGGVYHDHRQHEQARAPHYRHSPLTSTQLPIASSDRESIRVNAVAPGPTNTGMLTAYPEGQQTGAI
jgi:hypothetical protein